MRQGILLRRARPYELSAVRRFILRHFPERWADEAVVALSHQPVGCFLATRDAKIVGFACYDATARGFFGPTGVEPDQRKQGVGTALLMASLHGLRDKGFAYAIIGAAGPVPFYVKTVGAWEIPESSSDTYADRLGDDSKF